MKLVCLQRICRIEDICPGALKQLDLLPSPLYTELVGPLKKKRTLDTERVRLLGDMIRPQLSDGWLRVLGMISAYHVRKEPLSSTPHIRRSTSSCTIWYPPTFQHPHLPPFPFWITLPRTCWPSLSFLNIPTSVLLQDPCVC